MQAAMTAFAAGYIAVSHYIIGRVTRELFYWYLIVLLKSQKLIQDRTPVDFIYVHSVLNKLWWSAAQNMQTFRQRGPNFIWTMILKVNRCATTLNGSFKQFLLWTMVATISYFIGTMANS